jgi:hypothetical protein
MDWEKSGRIGGIGAAIRAELCSISGGLNIQPFGPAFTSAQQPFRTIPLRAVIGKTTVEVALIFGLSSSLRRNCADQSMATFQLPCATRPSREQAGQYF